MYIVPLSLISNPFSYKEHTQGLGLNIYFFDIIYIDILTQGGLDTLLDPGFLSYCNPGKGSGQTHPWYPSSGALKFQNSNSPNR